MSVDPGPYDASSTYVHLDDGGAGTPLAVTETFWQEAMAGAMPELERGRLVSQFSFADPWPSWERHPAGEEIVVLLSGAVDFVLEVDGVEQVVSLQRPGGFVIVPRNVWHTARPRQPTSMLFITPGQDTDHRPA